MGWASGEQLFADVWTRVRGYIPKAKRKEVLEEIIEAFEDRDADTLFDSVPEEWPEMVAIYKERYPPEEED
jgi:hypothetical protein